MELGPLVAVAGIAYIGFLEWLKHQRREMAHRERLAAIEKGLPPPADVEPERYRWSVQRLLLLGGLVWLSLGISAFVVISAILSADVGRTLDIPHGLQWIGLAPATIGFSHLIVFALGRRKDI